MNNKWLSLSGGGGVCLIAIRILLGCIVHVAVRRRIVQ